GMPAVELDGDRAAPGEAGDVRGAEPHRVDQLGEALRVAGQREPGRQVGRAARARLVPGDDRELVRQTFELRLPCATVLSGTVHGYQRRPVPGSLVGDLEPVRPYDLHRVGLGGFESRGDAAPLDLPRVGAFDVPREPQALEHTDHRGGQVDL